jgi:small subunit ribosomal protein S4
MSRFTGAKKRVGRRFGANIFSLAKNKDATSPQRKRTAPPGQHGAKRSKKKSDYGLQLQQQQMVRACYGMITLKSLVNAYRKAVQLSSALKQDKAKENKGAAQILSELLEARLDIIVYRIGIAPTIFAAQQLVSHCHILVNGKKVNIRSALVKIGDVVSVKEASRAMPLISGTIEARSSIPDYLHADETDKWSWKLGSLPLHTEVQTSVPLNFPQVCDWLSNRS